jgi:hypothetical protein
LETYELTLTPRIIKTEAVADILVLLRMSFVRLTREKGPRSALSRARTETVGHMYVFHLA